MRTLEEAGFRKSIGKYGKFSIHKLVRLISQIISPFDFTSSILLSGRTVMVLLVWKSRRPLAGPVYLLKSLGRLVVTYEEWWYNI